MYIKPFWVWRFVYLIVGEKGLSQVWVWDRSYSFRLKCGGYTADAVVGVLLCKAQTCKAAYFRDIVSQFLYVGISIEIYYIFSSLGNKACRVD